MLRVLLMTVASLYGWKLATCAVDGKEMGMPSAGNS